KSRLQKAKDEKLQKANRISQAGNMSKREKRAKANRMFETKSKGTSQKSIQKAAKAIEQRMERLKEIEPVKEETPIVFPLSKLLQLHHYFPIMAEEFTMQISGNILLDDVRFQFPLRKKNSRYWQK